MITDQNDPMYWINNGLKHATTQLVDLSGATAAVIIVTEFVTRNDPPTPLESDMIEKVAELRPMLDQFQQHYATIAGAGWKDEAFNKPARWFSDTPPVTVDPES